MKILVIGDLHGRKPKIHFKEFDCIIQVGDVCDDSGFRPYIKKWFKAIKKDRENTPSLDKFMKKDLGVKGMDKLDRESLNHGRKLMEFFDSFGKPVFFVPGNWDQSYGKSKIKNLDKDDYSYRKAFYEFYLGKNANPKLVKGLKNVYDCQFKLHEFNNINFVGYGLSSAPEILKKRNMKLNISKNQLIMLKATLNKIFNQIVFAYSKRKKEFPVVFISHNIPYKTKLDVVKNKNSYADKMHLGSFIARKFCERYKPLICVGGHVHESPGKDKIGKTILVNPGFGENAQVLIDIDEEKKRIRKIKFFGNNKKHNH